GFFFTGFFWKPCIPLYFFYSCISAIRYSTALFCPAHFAFFKQLKIMLHPITKICTDYLFCSLIYNNLALYCMSFLLTRIKMFLLIVSIFYPVLLPDFFLGRSIGVSDASISRTSYSTSLFK